MNHDEIFDSMCLEVLGEKIEEVTKPVANYIPCVRSGKKLFVAGQGPFVNNKEIYIGKIGKEKSSDEGYKSAQLCALNALAQIKSAIGSLNKIKNIVYLRGYVNSVNDFYNQPAVINGASDMLVKIFGEAGRHARCAISVNSLPNNITTEVELVVELD